MNFRFRRNNTIVMNVASAGNFSCFVFQLLCDSTVLLSFFWSASFCYAWWTFLKLLVYDSFSAELEARRIFSIATDAVSKLNNLPSHTLHLLTQLAKKWKSPALIHHVWILLNFLKQAAAIQSQWEMPIDVWREQCTTIALFALR